MTGIGDSTSEEQLQFPDGRRGRKKFLLAVALVALVGAIGYWQFGPEELPEDLPLLATAEIGSIENTVASAGTLKPSRFVDVGAQVSGQLKVLHVEVGDVVQEGQLLAEIDARVQESRVNASRANIAAQEASLEGRRAALDLARANAARQERLMAEDATSQLEFDNAVNNLANAIASLEQLQSQIQQSKATLASDETQLEFTKIYAPVSGTIVTIEMTEGRTLNAAQQAPNILRIADLSTMTVEADISEADIGSVRPGMEVYFTTLGGGSRRWYGTVRQILPTPEVLNNVVLYTGLFDIENPDGMLLSEMTAQVYFITSSAQDVLTVPLGAVRFPSQQELAARLAPAPDGTVRTPPGGSGALPATGARGPGLIIANGGNARGRAPNGPRPGKVTVMEPDGTQEERDVMVGVTSRVSAEIISGLRAGEQVVAGIIQAAADTSEQQQNFPGGFGGGIRIR